MQVVVLLGEDAAVDLKSRGLTTSRARVLWRLLDGAKTQRELATALEVSPRTITDLVDGLTKTGFVTREPHPGDRRATLVTLTARGTATLEELAQSRRTFARQLFGDLPHEQLDCLASGLDAVLAQLRELVATGKQEKVR
jgi:DNA-binding MarR family transcriptional regulator